MGTILKLPENLIKSVHKFISKQIVLYEINFNDWINPNLAMFILQQIVVSWFRMYTSKTFPLV